MEPSIITRIIIPLAIAFIMFGMGLCLTTHDFKRIWRHPKAILTGIILQIVGLPVLGFVFVRLSGIDDPVMAASVMILSACPGGAITNLVSFICKGDPALSVSLTAMNSLITVVTIPVMVPFFLYYFMGEAVAGQVSAVSLSLGIIIITIPPMAAGMAVKRQAPKLAEKSERSVRNGTLVFLVFLASFAFYNERQMLMANYEALFLIAACLCLLSLFMGAFVSMVLALPGKHVLTLAIEVGLHNSAMGIVIATSFLEMSSLAVFSAFYLVVEYLVSAILMIGANTPWVKAAFNGEPPVT